MIVNGLILCLLLVISPVLCCDHESKQSVNKPPPSPVKERDIISARDQIKVPSDEPLTRLDQVAQQLPGQKEKIRDNLPRIKRSYLHLKARTEHEQYKAQTEPRYQVLRASKLNQEPPQLQREEQRRDEILSPQREEQKREEIPLQQKQEEQKREELPIIVQREEQKREEVSLPLQKIEEQKREDSLQKDGQKRDEPSLVQRDELKRDELPLAIIQKEEQKREEISPSVQKLSEEQKREESSTLQKEEQKRGETLLVEEGKRRDGDQLQQKEVPKLETIQYAKKGGPTHQEPQRLERPFELPATKSLDKIESDMHPKLNSKEGSLREEIKSQKLKYDQAPMSDVRAPATEIKKEQQQQQHDIGKSSVDSSRTLTLLTDYEVAPNLQTLVVTRELIQQQNTEQKGQRLNGKTREEQPIKQTQNLIQSTRLEQPKGGEQLTHSQPITQDEIKGAKRLEEPLLTRAPVKGGQKSIPQQQEDRLELQINQQDTIKTSELRASRFPTELRPRGFEYATSHSRLYHPSRPTYTYPAVYPNIPAVFIRSNPAPLVRSGPVVSPAHLQRARYPPSPIQGYRRNHRTGLDQTVYGRPRVSFYSQLTRQIGDNGLSSF